MHKAFTLSHPHTVRCWLCRRKVFVWAISDPWRTGRLLVGGPWGRKKKEDLHLTSSQRHRVCEKCSWACSKGRRRITNCYRCFRTKNLLLMGVILQRVWMWIHNYCVFGRLISVQCLQSTNRRRRRQGGERHRLQLKKAVPSLSHDELYTTTTMTVFRSIQKVRKWRK